jgi:hypothetical protein
VWISLPILWRQPNLPEEPAHAPPNVLTAVDLTLIGYRFGYEINNSPSGIQRRKGILENHLHLRLYVRRLVAIS